MRDMSNLDNSPALDIPQTDAKQMLNVGVDLAHKEQRSGTFVQIDHGVLHASSQTDGLEVMNVDDALEAHPWMLDYWWKAVPKDRDEFTKATAEQPNHGYFIRALEGAKVSYPVQACLYIREKGLIQRVHNMIIAEEGSELNIITGCAVSMMAPIGMHIGISEFFVKRGATVTFTMTHNWAEQVEARPRSVIYLEDDSVFLSNYFCFRPVKMLQMYPTAYCRGKNSVARFNSVLLAQPGSHLDVGSRAYLQAPGARTEMIARTISKGGEIISRGHIVGEVPEVKGHLECRGMILTEKGRIYAVPELEGLVDNLDLSHEAAVGRIAEDEVQYLMSRGLTRDKATAAIVRGFLRVDIHGLPDALKSEIDRLMEATEGESM